MLGDTFTMVVGNPQGGTFSGECTSPSDRNTDNWLAPHLDQTVSEIVREVNQMYHNGTLLPFQEGQHVGVLPRRVRMKGVTPAQLIKAHNERREQQREDMLQLRARNDHTLASRLGRL